MLQTEILEGIYHHHGKFDLGLEITLVPDCNYVSCSTTPSAPFYLQVQSNSQTCRFKATPRPLSFWLKFFFSLVQ